MVQSSQGVEGTAIDGAFPSNPLRAGVVTFQNDEQRDSVIQGFTLTNGKGNYYDLSYTAYEGGGVCCRGTASPTITENIIIDNGPVMSRGGIFARGSPMVTFNVIRGNDGGEGAGYCNWHGGEEIISDNIIIDNTAGGEGGGINCDNTYGPEYVFKDNYIDGNIAKIRGG